MSHKSGPEIVIQTFSHSKLKLKQKKKGAGVRVQTD